MGDETKKPLGYVPLDRGTDGVYLRSLTDEEVAAFFPPPKKEILTGGTSGCFRIPILEELVLKPASAVEDNRKIARYVMALQRAHVLPLSFYNTVCILKFAISIAETLEELPTVLLKTEDHIAILQYLFNFRNEIERRTKSNYSISLTEYLPLDPVILSEYPFHDYLKWKEIIDKKKLIEQGKVLLWELIPAPSDPMKPNAEVKEEDAAESAEDMQNKMEDLQLKAERDGIDSRLLTVPASNTPVINKAIANLKLLSFKQVNKQTGSTYKPFLQKEDEKLWDWTYFIFYHSVFSVMLDMNGEPWDLHGKLDYPIIVPSPGFKFARLLQPKGFYVNTPEFHNYRIDGGTVKEILLGGISGFSKFGYGFTWEDEHHTTIQGELNSVREIIFAAIVTESVSNQRDLGIKSFFSELFDFTEVVIPYTIDEIIDRLEAIADDPGAFVIDVIKAALLTVVIEQVREYLIKKLGKKFVPVINLGFMIADLVGSDDEVIRIRHAIACVMMGIKGTTPDDKTIAAKILSKILADEFIDQVVFRLAMVGIKVAIKAKSYKGRRKTTADPTTTSPSTSGTGSTPATATPPTTTPTVRTKPDLPASPHTTKPVDTPAPPPSNPKTGDTATKHDGADGTSQRMVADENKGLTDDTKPSTDTTPAKPKSPDQKAGDAAADQPGAAKTDSPDSTGKTDSPDQQKVKDETDPSSKPKTDDADASPTQPATRAKETPSATKVDDTGTTPESTATKETGTTKESEATADTATAATATPPSAPDVNPVDRILKIPTNSSPRTFRRRLAALLKVNPDHPLIALIDGHGKLHASTKAGMDEFYWYEHPEAVQAGHVTSRHTGAPDKIVLMTAHENQMLKSTIETYGGFIRGGFDVKIIDGVPISVESAKHLVDFGKLSQKAFDDAPTYPVDQLP